MKSPSFLLVGIALIVGFTVGRFTEPMTLSAATNQPVQSVSLDRSPTLVEYHLHHFDRFVDVGAAHFSEEVKAYIEAVNQFREELSRPPALEFNIEKQSEVEALWYWYWREWEKDWTTAERSLSAENIRKMASALVERRAALEQQVQGL